MFSLAILRGAIFADHFENRDEFCRYMDRGDHEFTCTIFPFESFGNSERRAQMLNNRPTVIVETFHHGQLGTKYAGISISEDNITVTALKKHEDTNAYILRYYKNENKKTRAKSEFLILNLRRNLERMR